MNNIPTAEEYVNLGFSLNKNTFDTNVFDRLQFTGKRVKELMIEFARLHVTAALEAATRDGLISIASVYGDECSLVKSETVRYNSMGVYRVYAEDCTRHTISITEDSILNSYPLTNIK